MNKLKLASLTLLLAGATALPAMAQSAGGEQARQGGRGNGDLDKGPAQTYDRGDRGEGRGDRGEGRGDRGEGRGDRGENRGDGRGDRQDWQANQGYRGDSRGEDRREWRDDRRDDRRDWRDDRRDDRNDWRDDRRDHNRYVRHNDRRWNGNQWYPQYRYRAPVRYVYPRGYRAYQWRVGHRLPASYYHNSYYVDYNAYRLPPPPYGYRWVRVDRDVVLVAVASGLIRDILYGLYY